MDNNEKIQEFDLDDILKEYGGGPETDDSEELISQEELDAAFAEEPEAEAVSTAVPSDTIRLERIADARTKAPETSVKEAEEEPEDPEEPEMAAETADVTDEPTIAVSVPEEEEKPQEQSAPVKPPLVYDPRARLRELRCALARETDPEAVWHLKRRVAELTPMLTQMNELAELTGRYYERGYYRSEKYTL